MDKQLFAGESLPFGGLSNEKELFDICPKEFRDFSNVWVEYAAALVFKRVKSAQNWRFRASDIKEQKRQYECLVGLLTTWELPHEEKMAIAGWMLSEMLEDVPQLE